ncbi:MAG: hypothetical protein PHX05_07135 [Acidobacteriota bacterium]|nr:hypothetical protein [Acidobacteriota bacterium]
MASNMAMGRTIQMKLGRIGPFVDWRGWAASGFVASAAGLLASGMVSISGIEAGALVASGTG